MPKRRFLHYIHIHANWSLVIVLSLLSLLNVFGRADAAQILNRSVNIGSSSATIATNHRFSFGIVTPAVVGSIEFEYCINSPQIGAPCVAPAGLSVNSATLQNQTGVTGFTMHSATASNRIVISRVPVASSPQQASYLFDGVMNPSAEQESVFVRISTFATDDASGVRIDEGAVVFTTARSLMTTGYVPPYLTFCVGLTVAVNCSTTDGNFIDFGELRRTAPAIGTSQFAGATNDTTGYIVSVHGNTLTSGNNLIPALAPGGASATGTSQYGLNLRQNSAPGVGQNPAGTGTSVVQPGYNSPNVFRFVSGDTITSSQLPTNFNRFTVSYLINVSQSQQPGVYAATMTYVATASF